MLNGHRDDWWKTRTEAVIVMPGVSFRCETFGQLTLGWVLPISGYGLYFSTLHEIRRCLVPDSGVR